MALGRPKKPATAASGEALLEGAWKNADGSAYYVRVVDSRLRGVYCFRGDDRRTAEIYDWTARGDAFLARFRWFDARIRGMMMLKVASRDKLVGGWWTGGENAPLKEPWFASNQIPMVLERSKEAEIPQWAEEYFRQEMWEKR